jgi:hypothetical protein
MAITVDKTTNVIKITGSVTTTASTVSLNRECIKKIVWYGATTNGHDLILTDTAGNIIYKAQMATTCLTENIQADFPFGLHVVGISCYNLDSGEVYIYI